MVPDERRGECVELICVLDVFDGGKLEKDTDACFALAVLDLAVDIVLCRVVDGPWVRSVRCDAKELVVDRGRYEVLDKRFVLLVECVELARLEKLDVDRWDENVLGREDVVDTDTEDVVATCTELPVDITGCELVEGVKEATELDRVLAGDVEVCELKAELNEDAFALEEGVAAFHVELVVEKVA